VSPLIVYAAFEVTHVCRPGNALTRYPLIGSPPAKVGIFHDTRTDSTPATAFTSRGPPGTLGSETTETVPDP